MEVKVMQDILGENDTIAAAVHQRLVEHGIFVINLLGSPGSGKTSILEKTVEALKNEIRIAVIEGDLFTAKDAERIASYDVPVIQINTSGGCHLDAPMIQKALTELDLDELDLLIIENVGNLVCPAEFALGEDVKVAVLSVTEGNDKPLKYPLAFKESVLTLINKSDLVPYTNFVMEEAVEDIMTIHPEAQVLPVSALTGEGLEDWFDWLRCRIQERRSRWEMQEEVPLADIVVLGIGNIVLRDDGLGVRVVEHLEDHYDFPDNVQVLDGGTLGMELLRFITPAKRILLLDAIHGGQVPGTMYRLEGDAVQAHFQEKISAHEIGIQDVLTLLSLTGKPMPEIVVLGVEPLDLAVGLELSEELSQAVPVLAERAVEELRQWGLTIKARV